MKRCKLLISLAAGLMAFTAVASNTTPVHRPLIEEYTGTWCGYCVRGFAGMELLRETFGDDFIGVAIHNGDAMHVLNSSDYPNDIDGFPTAFIDRTSEADPLYGFGNNTGDIVTTMQQFAALEVIAGIDVTAQWTSADKTGIKVDVTSYFTIDDNSGNYAIEVMLIADDLYGSGSDWNQSNYYSGWNSYRNDPYLGEWVRKSGTVTGLHFNDVLVGTSGVVANSLPTSLVAYNDNQFSYTFTLSRLPVPSLIQNKDNLHVIAIVVNKSNGQVVNANRCYISDYNPVIVGDVNDDGFVTIADVTALIDYLLGGDDSSINLDNAEIDGVNGISIADVTALIDNLLSGN